MGHNKVSPSGDWAAPADGLRSLRLDSVHSVIQMADGNEVEVLASTYDPFEDVALQHLMVTVICQNENFFNARHLFGMRLNRLA